MQIRQTECGCQNRAASAIGGGLPGIHRDLQVAESLFRTCQGHFPARGGAGIGAVCWCTFPRAWPALFEHCRVEIAEERGCLTWSGLYPLKAEERNKARCKNRSLLRKRKYVLVSFNQKLLHPTVSACIGNGKQVQSCRQISSRNRLAGST